MSILQKIMGNQSLKRQFCLVEYGGKSAEVVERGDAGHLLLSGLHGVQHLGRHTDPHLRVRQGPKIRGLCRGLSGGRPVEVNIQIAKYFLKSRSLKYKIYYYKY